MDTWYKQTCHEILMQKQELNARTNTNVYALPHVLYTHDMKNGFPLLSLRKISKAFVAEALWFITGDKSLDFLQRYTKIWDGFKEGDNTVTSAYGYRLRYHFSVDQIETVLDKLKADSSTRHGVLQIWSPLEDLTVPQKNVPCPYTAVMNIIDGRLNLSVIARSTDMVLGFPTDVATWALLQTIFAQELDVEVGIFSFFSAHAHIYEPHVEVVETMLAQTSALSLPTIGIPKDTYQMAYEKDSGLFDAINVHGYNPSMAITGIPIMK